MSVHGRRNIIQCELCHFLILKGFDPTANAENLEALNRGVLEVTIDRNNIWWKVEKVGSRKEKLKIRDHYIKVLVVLNCLLQYS